MNGGANKLGQRGGVNATFVDGLAATAGDTSWPYDALGQLTSANAPVAVTDRAYSFDTINPLSPGLRTAL